MSSTFKKSLGKTNMPRTSLGGVPLKPELVLTGGTLVCGTLIAAQAFTGTDKHGTDDPGTWGHSFFIREMAVCFVFLILALLAMLGSVASKAAVGIGLLVTMAVVLDSNQLLEFLAGTLNKENADKDLSDSTGGAQPTQKNPGNPSATNGTKNSHGVLTPNGVTTPSGGAATNQTPGTHLGNPASGIGAP